MTTESIRIGTKARRNGAPHGVGCPCPVCEGLHTFVRPRFFAGQLLTETELTALTGYMTGKQRLHNRYLHGYGVVVGLQVECDGCGPGVLVRPGYAIDPCGADIVLPEAISIPIAKLIADCATAKKPDDCDPPRYPRAEGCSDREEVWCLWARYREQQSRPVTPLGGAAASTGCGCGGHAGSGHAGSGHAGSGYPGSGHAGSGYPGSGYGGAGYPGFGHGGAGYPGAASGGTGSLASGAGSGSSSASGGCGCGGAPVSRATTCGCSNAPTLPTRPAACEPSRIYEYVEFGVAPKDADCTSIGGALQGTFPAKVLECIKGLMPMLAKGMTKSMQSSALSLAMGGQAGLARGLARDAICQLYANVVELYRNDPMRTLCVLPEALSEIDCSPQGPNESDSQFKARLSQAVQQLIMLVLLYLRDCVCYAALPPVPGAACDDRVVLACVTVKSGVVTKVCNHACRRYAGSFVNREYWLPIGPVLSLLAAKICCFPLALGWTFNGQDDIRDPRLDMFAAMRGTQARYSNLLNAVHSDDFALLRLWRDRVRNAATKVRLAAVLAGLEHSLERTTGSVQLATYLHSDAAKAAASLGRQGVEVELVEVADRVEGLAFDAIPRVVRGGRATLYTHGGLVVGVKGSQGIDLGRRGGR